MWCIPFFVYHKVRLCCHEKTCKGYNSWLFVLQYSDKFKIAFSYLIAWKKKLKYWIYLKSLKFFIQQMEKIHKKNHAKLCNIIFKRK